MSFLSKIGLEERLVIELPINQEQFLERLAIDLEKDQGERIRIPKLYQGKLDKEQFVIQRKKQSGSIKEDYTICEGHWGKKEGKTILLCNIKPLNSIALRQLLLRWVLGFISLFGVFMATGLSESSLAIGLFIVLIAGSIFLNIVNISRHSKQMKQDMRVYFRALMVHS